MAGQPGTTLGEALGTTAGVPDAALDEIIVWESRANWFQSRIRAVGGRFYITERHLVFIPHEFDASLAGRAWSAPLADLERAYVKGWLKMIRVVFHSGNEEKFVLPRRQESAERINRAIQAA